MLPDLPQLKHELQRVIDQYLRRQVQARLGVFDKAPKHVIHEGERMRIIRADGTVDENELKESSAEMSINMDEIPTLTLDERIKRLDAMAEDMAKQMSLHLFGVLNEGLDKAGQVVDGKGKPFDAEAFFAAIEAVQIDFDEAGEQHNMSLVIPPNMGDRVKAVLGQIEEDPNLRQRHAELMARKRMEWRDREAARKLVG